MSWKALTVAAAAMLIVIAGSSGAAAAPTKPKVSWNGCYRDFGPVQCRTVQVPLDYDGSDRGALSIALLRLPATQPSRRGGSPVRTPSGPGGSGGSLTL